MRARTNRFRLIVALSLSILLGGCAGAGQNTGQFVDDSLITTKIKSKLVGDMMLKGFTIKVDTDRGAVRLGGTVDSATQRLRAEEVAQGTEGVKSVVNEIAVRP
ncbi:MAG TPA: BON domain-containing protein [Burkholderiales bacterium]|nr:BON domain-containing protein [Burkholderiales bacterium]